MCRKKKRGVKRKCDDPDEKGISQDGSSPQISDGDSEEMGVENVDREGEEENTDNRTTTTRNKKNEKIHIFKKIWMTRRT